MPSVSLAHPLFVIIGPSGSGKTSVTQSVFPHDAKVITHTTRKKRSGEVQGVDYYFETEESFAKLYHAGQLVEQDFYHGHHYGVSKAEIIRRTTEKPAYAILTFPGLEKVYNCFPLNTVVIFFKVNQVHVKARLTQREEEPRIIAERLALFNKENQAEKTLETYPRFYRLDANQPFSDVRSDLKKIVKRES